MHTDSLSLAVLHFSLHSFTIGGVGRTSGDLSIKLYLTHCIDVIVIVFGSLSSGDNVVTSSVLRARR